MTGADHITLKGRKLWLAILVSMAMLAAACGQAAAPTETPEPSPAPTATPTPAPSPTATPDLTFAPDDERRALRFQSLEGWETDFSHKQVGLEEFTSVLPKDAIAPVDEPAFAPVSSPPDYMRPREPVIALEINGDARAYPLAMLMWHEIVNDTVGSVPVSITFCPLCNTAIAFERVVDGEELTFGTTGKLRHSDLVMWDRQTQSWWQQATGEALVGRYAADGTQLEFINSPIIAWETFVEQYPEGQVLERIFNDRGFPIRRYDLAPYAGYDSVDTNPFLFDGEVDERLPANQRVLTVETDGVSVAYPFPFLEAHEVINDSVGSLDITVFFDNETLSAFVDELERPQTAGSTTVFSRELNGRALTFQGVGGDIRDIETGSRWNLLGKAVEGELAGSELEPVSHANHFWFAWAVFKPETEVRDSEEDVSGPVSG